MPPHRRAQAFTERRDQQGEVVKAMVKMFAIFFRGGLFLAVSSSLRE
jgi:hypothetical protein